MPCAARCLVDRGALPLGCALIALWACPAHASDFRLLTPDTFQLTGDVRVIAVDGEKSWLGGGLGKLRSGSDGDWRASAQIGNLNVVWQPQFSWSLSATIVGSIQGGERSKAGLSQAFVSFRPMRSSNGRLVSARAGLMWPPVSLEHEGADWHVADSITPSAINSWIGEEIRPVAVEGTITGNLGAQKLRATAALLAANDTSGTLLTFRGWALHDRTTLAFNRWDLPPLRGMIATIQAPYTHPLADLHGGFAHRPGYYAKVSWQLPIPLRVELFRYDNCVRPTVVNPDLEWGWRTSFDNLGLLANPGGGVVLKAQALQGRTRMGFAMDGRRWVDNHFRSAFLLATKAIGHFSVTTRAEVFETRNRGSIVTSGSDEKGWSAMLAGKRDWKHFTGLLEFLHVSSSRKDPAVSGFARPGRQTELQAELRMHW
jgi:hypothetical protein